MTSPEKTPPADDPGPAHRCEWCGVTSDDDMDEVFDEYGWPTIWLCQPCGEKYWAQDDDATVAADALLDERKHERGRA